MADFLNHLPSVIALVILEIILGIDNLVFLSILTEKLPQQQRRKARRWGLGFAWITRLLLLASAVWLAKMTTPIIEYGESHLSVRDIFLFLGGLFLIVKATQEIHVEMGDADDRYRDSAKHYGAFAMVVAQIAVMDIIFSLDSVLTAIGLTPLFSVMALAITIAIFVMIFASDAISHFIEGHPTIKMLALSFLILIGMVLVADAFAFHIPRGYVYFAMGFSLGVECLNLLRRARRRARTR